MRRLLVSLVLVAIVLAVPIAPFALWGEELVSAWLDENMSPAMVAALVVGLLAGDLVLPVPSSVLSTFAANRLGLWGGLTASWVGLTLGALLAFVLGRWLGYPLASRLAGAAEMARTERLAERYGPAVLALARPLPVLAEASVLLFGATRLAWRRFLPPVLLSNLGIALAYSILGDQFELPAALVLSVALPLLLALVARRLWPART